MMSIVMVMASMSVSPMSSMISSESTIVVVTIVFVVISPIVAVSIMRMLLEGRFRMVFVNSQLPLPILSLLDVVI